MKNPKTVTKYCEVFSQDKNIEDTLACYDINLKELYSSKQEAKKDIDTNEYGEHVGYLEITVKYVKKGK